MRLRIAILVFAALGGIAFTSTAASAMPNGIPKANEIIGQPSNIQEARWVCPPRGRCFWRPGWRGARDFYGRRPWGPRPRRWHRW
ncbi:MAG TPA: hypothetical protein VHB49_15720 [Bradyrhizobium sp.]|nr:hypothetical protein [Bradyrhizobium sp.]